MSGKERSAELVGRFINVLRCPFCGSPMKVVDLKSLICSENHTFDFARRGYLNMMGRLSNSHYNKKLFESRQQMISESGLYGSLHERIAKIIKEHLDGFNQPIIIFDAGCGEGSHLQMILDKCKNEAVMGVGLDISKEGIRMAAGKYRTSIWLVGDLAQSPMADQSCHVIFNMLSPANYLDFKRILVPNGLVIKVIPRSNYLKELRQALFNDSNKKIYTNAQTVSLFKKHFRLVNIINLSYTKELDHKDLIHLVQMSPLAWHSKKETMAAFINQKASEVTVDLDILVGLNKQSEGGGGYGESMD